MILTTSSILILVLVPLVGFLAAKWLFQKDTEVENRRRGAANLAGVLQTYGLKKTPEFLIDYSVGDYSGMAHKISDLARLFLDGEEHVVKEFQHVFDRVLEAKLQSAEGRAYIAAKLSETAKPVAVQPAVQPTVQPTSPSPLKPAVV
jgi:hypothetical protein